MNALFPEIKIKTLSDADFNLNSDDMITIKDKRVAVVLFHDTEPDSQHIVEYYKNIAKRIAGVVFYACDMTSQNGISQAFLKLSDDSTSPYQKFTVHGLPSLIVYKNSKPQMIYNGLIDEHSLLLFCASIVNLKIEKDTEINQIEENIPKAIPKDT